MRINTSAVETLKGRFAITFTGVLSSSAIACSVSVGVGVVLVVDDDDSVDSVGDGEDVCVLGSIAACSISCRNLP